MAILHIVVLALVSTISARSIALKTRQSPAILPAGSALLSIQASGNGCPHDTANIVLDNASQTAVITNLTEFRAKIGPDGRRDATKNCAFHASVQAPQGYQFTLLQSVYAGYARLDAGVGGRFAASYFLSSNASDVVGRTIFLEGKSFLEGSTFEIDLEHGTPRDYHKWSNCGQSDIANINNRISLVAEAEPIESGELIANAAPNQTVSVLWRQCTQMA
ncbi:hypothetical protein EJ08DRAFT_645900 [Tothia fuscella]|uniref:Secreted protein n=1 Tax=Tothia fuscella TaxID=1048955 RepID=A0A9P4P0E4_9PEZI|nr:hypothetical protein EJ08DRAFT_645900 [Tothia fuscella]